MNIPLVSLIEQCQAIQNINIIAPTITLLAGAWLGNKYAVGRDQRNSFLAITRPIHEILTTQLAREGDDIFTGTVKEDQLLRLRSYYAHGSWWYRIKGIGYDKAIQDYKEYGKVESVFDEYNYSKHVYPDAGMYRDAIKKLLKYTPIS